MTALSYNWDPYVWMLDGLQAFSNSVEGPTVSEACRFMEGPVWVRLALYVLILTGLLLLSRCLRGSGRLTFAGLGGGLANMFDQAEASGLPPVILVAGFFLGLIWICTPLALSVATPVMLAMPKAQSMEQFYHLALTDRAALVLCVPFSTYAASVVTYRFLIPGALLILALMVGLGISYWLLYGIHVLFFE